MTKTIDRLQEFTGSENWYRHPLVCSMLYTDGAKYVADTAGAYWLIDSICLAQQGVAALKGEEFQQWQLTVRSDSSAELTCEDGNGRVLHTEAIPFTDFPPKGIKLWVENSTLYLPGER